MTRSPSDGRTAHEDRDSDTCLYDAGSGRPTDPDLLELPADQTEGLTSLLPWLRVSPTHRVSLNVSNCRSLVLGPKD